MTDARLKILIAEDDDDDFMFFKEDLARFCRPCEILRAKNGEEALQCLEKYVPDAIFLDKHMPLMDGLEVLIEIRKSDRFRAVPIVVLTGSQREEDLVKLSFKTAAVRKPLAAHAEQFHEVCRNLGLDILKQA